MITISITSIFYAFYLFISRDNQVYIQIRNDFLKLADEIERICYEEEGARSQVLVYIPVQVMKTINESNAIGFRIKNQDFVFFPPCNVTVNGSFKSGGNLVEIVKRRGYVEVIIR